MMVAESLIIHILYVYVAVVVVGQKDDDTIEIENIARGNKK